MRCEGNCCDAVVADVDVVAALVVVLEIVIDPPRCLRPLHH